MSKHFRQCRYTRLDGSAWDESWIPESLAKVGRLIHFGDASKMFRVVSVGSRRRTRAEMHKNTAERKVFGPSIQSDKGRS